MANMSICNITESANYFHVLRRQLLRSNFRKPLIIMSPKKLLRYKRANSGVKEFVGVDRFREVIGEPYTAELDNSQKIKKVIFCSGQVYYDLLEKREELKQKVVRRITIGHSYSQD